MMYIRKSDCSKRGDNYMVAYSDFRPFTELDSFLGRLKFLKRDPIAFIYQAQDGRTIRIIKA